MEDWICTFPSSCGTVSPVKMTIQSMSKAITAKKLRDKYLSFFQGKKHAVIASASVVPENDPTSLFIGSGMQPLVPYLAGTKHPAGTRLVAIQKCIRTIDIDEVGDDTHLTFFEMLGNWSLGDYFKTKSITWSFEFLTSPHYLNIPLERLAITCYQGNEKYKVPKDITSYDLWNSMGVSPDRISYLGDDDNWWPKIDMDGLCGPDTEIFYWSDNSEPAPAIHDSSDERWVEIWNNVFMQFEFKSGTISELKKQNVDTGMGLERTLIALNGYNDIYESELFKPAIKILEKEAHTTYKSSPHTTKSIRIICDHIRSAVVLISDGITPGNVDQGYVLRRLIRRAIREAKKIEITTLFTRTLSTFFVESLRDTYATIDKLADKIIHTLEAEEIQFEKTLHKGIKEFEKITQSLKSGDTISGKDCFTLYDTYGFPIEMTEELASENGFEIDKAGFDVAYEAHKELSRANSAQKFAGGLADHSTEVVNLHTATHLMLEAMRQVLGDHVDQRGSNITSERLRFDVSHGEKITKEQIAQIESIVNEQIQKDLKIHVEEMTVQAAMDRNATGIFVDKYENDLVGKVKVYFMGDFSTEICGGPHAEHTGALGVFKVKKEQSSGSGVRRIKAVLQ